MKYTFKCLNNDLLLFIPFIQLFDCLCPNKWIDLDIEFLLHTVWIWKELNKVAKLARPEGVFQHYGQKESSELKVSEVENF